MKCRRCGKSSKTKWCGSCRSKHKMYQRKVKLSRDIKYPYYVNVPMDSVSPTGSIYKRFDIVSQEAVLNEFGDNPKKVRSSKPFVIEFEQIFRGKKRIKRVKSLAKQLIKKT